MLVRMLVGSAVVLIALGAMAGAPRSIAQPACAPTRPDMLGPFYKTGAPERTETGRGLVIAGTVRSASGCAPLAGAQLEWWSAGSQGYDDAHRATERTGSDGRFRYATDFPTGYSGRPPHVHVRVTAPGHRVLVTQLYPKAGETSLSVDFVLSAE